MDEIKKSITINGKSNVYKYLKSTLNEEKEKYNIRNVINIFYYFEM